MTEVLVREQLAQSHYLTVEWPGVELATFRLLVRHRNHYTTNPQITNNASAETLPLEAVLETEPTLPVPAFCGTCDDDGGVL